MSINALENGMIPSERFSLRSESELESRRAAREEREAEARLDAWLDGLASADLRRDERERQNAKG